MKERVYAVMKKEFRQISRDKGTIGVLLVVPLFLLVMFGYAISLDVRSIPLGVVDHDRSPASRAFLDAFVNSEYFVRVGNFESPDEAAEALATGEVLVVVSLPPGFGRTLGRGQVADVQVLVDGSNGNTAATAIGYVEALAREYSGRLSVSSPRPPVEPRPRVLFNQELRSVNFLVPGLVALILVLASVVSTSLSVVREKEHGTMEQVLVSPISPVELIIGKTLPYLLIGLVSATFILLTSFLVFGVAVKGSYLLLFFMTLIFLLACLGLGLLISSVADTQQVAFMMSSMLTLLPTFLLSGFVFPIRNMPPVIQAVTYLFPTRYYLEILRSIMLKGGGLHAILAPGAQLIAYAVLTMALSSARLSRLGASS